MKRITINGRHYIWNKRKFAENMAKGLFAVSTGAFYAYMFMHMIGGLR